MTEEELLKFNEDKFKNKTSNKPNDIFIVIYNLYYLILGYIKGALGANLNTSNPTLQLGDRGYYNYIGSTNANWMLAPPVQLAAGRFYRIYNKSQNQSTLTIWGNGSNIFRGGMEYPTVELNYGENLTMVFDGNEWNTYN